MNTIDNDIIAVAYILPKRNSDIVLLIAKKDYERFKNSENVVCMSCYLSNGTATRMTVEQAMTFNPFGIVESKDQSKVFIGMINSKFTDSEIKKINKNLPKREENIESSLERKSLSIYEYNDFIRYFPYENQSFVISYKNWITTNQKDYIYSKVFKNKDLIIINRNDLLNSSIEIKELIIKILLWGYPTKGRGKNIETILEPENLQKLIKILENYKNKNIEIKQIKSDIKSLKGIGISTFTKFLYFLKTKVNGYNSLILDDRIINTIKDNKYEELNHLSKMRRQNALNYYEGYLKTLENISKKINCKPDQIEIFLFSFGQNLSK